MTLGQAKKLKLGDRICAVIESPEGGESYWSELTCQWKYLPVCKGQVVVFKKIIPKVRVINHNPWQDGHAVMLFCKTLDGDRAWLNIGNAKKEETRRIT